MTLLLIGTKVRKEINMKFIATIKYHGLMGEVIENHIAKESQKAFEQLMFEEHNWFAEEFNNMIPEWNSKWYEIHPELKGEVMDEISLMKYNRYMFDNSQPIVMEVNKNVEDNLGLFKIVINNSIPKIRVDAKTLETYFEIPRLGTKEDGSYAQIILIPVEE